MHASEFDENLLEGTSQPVRSFLEKYKGKTVNVKIICFSKVKEEKEKEDRSKPKGKGKKNSEKMIVVGLQKFLIFFPFYAHQQCW